MLILIFMKGKFAAVVSVIWLNMSCLLVFINIFIFQIGLVYLLSTCDKVLFRDV